MKETHPEIPAGDYCYARHLCPHFVSRNVNGVDLPWCNHLNLGSVPGEAGSLTDTQHSLLRDAWGPRPYTEQELLDEVKSGHYPSLEEAKTAYETYYVTPKEFDLFLLWDQCKECGVNNDEYVELAGPFNYGPSSCAPGYPHRVITLTVTAKLHGSIKESRNFELVYTITKNAPLGVQVRELCSHLQRIPAMLKKNLGLTKWLVTHPAIPDWANGESVNFVALAAAIAGHEKRAGRHGRQLTA